MTQSHFENNTVFDSGLDATIDPKLTLIGRRIATPVPIYKTPPSSIATPMPNKGPNSKNPNRGTPRTNSERGKPYNRTVKATTVNGHFRQFTPRILLSNVAGVACWEKAEGLAQFIESRCFHPEIFRFYYEKIIPVMTELRDTYRVPLIELERLFLRFLPYTRSRQFARTLRNGAFPFDFDSPESKEDMIKLSCFFLGTEPAQFDINGYIRHCGGANYLDWGKVQEPSRSPIYDPFRPSTPNPFNPFDDTDSDSMPSLLTVSDSSLSELEAEAREYIVIEDSDEELEEGEIKEKAVDQSVVIVDALLPDLPVRSADPGANPPTYHATNVPKVASPTPSIIELPTELKQLYVTGPHVVMANGALNAYSLLRENMHLESSRLVYDSKNDTYHIRIRTCSSRLNTLHPDNIWDCPQNTIGTMHHEKDPISGTDNSFFVFQPGPRIFPRSLSLRNIPEKEKPFFHPSMLDPRDRIC